MENTAKLLRSALRLLLAACAVSLSLFAGVAAGQEYPVTEGDLVLPGGDAVMEPGERVALAGGGFLPGADVRITLHSNPLLLAVVAADAAGTIDVRVAIPDAVDPGAHTIRATGADPDGGVRVLSVAVTVVADDPSPGNGGDSTTSAGETSTGGSSRSDDRGATGTALPTTGAHVAVPAAVALALISAGGLVLAGRRKRKSRA